MRRSRAARLLRDIYLSSRTGRSAPVGGCPLVPGLLINNDSARAGLGSCMRAATRAEACWLLPTARRATVLQSRLLTVCLLYCYSIGSANATGAMTGAAAGGARRAAQRPCAAGVAVTWRLLPPGAAVGMVGSEAVGEAVGEARTWRHKRHGHGLRKLKRRSWTSSSLAPPRCVDFGSLLHLNPFSSSSLELQSQHFERLRTCNPLHESVIAVHACHPRAPAPPEGL